MSIAEPFISEDTLQPILCHRCKAKPAWFLVFWDDQGFEVFMPDFLSHAYVFGFFAHEQRQHYFCRDCYGGPIPKEE
jgi:hypothetical protein